jgi:23S rRNA (uridine2552-2'-O)-methyltransferase
MVYTPHDSFYKRAKQEGFRSRAAYKLLELQRRYHLLRTGDTVIDLGAAPGGWLQVISKIVGPRGKIIGVDLQAIQPFHEHNIIFLQGDMTSAGMQKKIKDLLSRPADCALSDMAPKLSGIRDADTARCLELNQIALRTAAELLRPGGSLLIKSFVSDELHGFTTEIKKQFSDVQRSKPEATRQGSSEFYFVAKGFAPKAGRPG